MGVINKIKEKTKRAFNGIIGFNNACKNCEDTIWAHEQFCNDECAGQWIHGRSQRIKKFDLTRMVKSGILKDGQTLYFIADPLKTVQVTKNTNGEFRFSEGGREIRLYSFVTNSLGQMPDYHPSNWVKDANGKTLFNLWCQIDSSSAIGLDKRKQQDPVEQDS